MIRRPPRSTLFPYTNALPICPRARGLRPHVGRNRPAPEGTTLVPNRRAADGPVCGWPDDAHARTLSAGTHETVPRTPRPNPPDDGRPDAYPRSPHSPGPRMAFSHDADLRGGGAGRLRGRVRRRVRAETDRTTRGRPPHPLRECTPAAKHKRRGYFAEVRWGKGNPALAMGR